MLLIGSVCIFFISMFMEPHGIQEMNVAGIGVWAVFLISAIVATGLGHLFYNLAISKIGASQTSIFNNLMPFFTLIGSVLFLGERIFIEQIIGFIFIVLGVILGTGYLEDRLKISIKFQEVKRDE